MSHAKLVSQSLQFPRLPQKLGGRFAEETKLMPRREIKDDVREQHDLYVNTVPPADAATCIKCAPVLNSIFITPR